VATLRESFAVPGRKAVVFAVSSDKPYESMLRVLAGYFDHFHLTRYGNNPRCVPPDRLAELLAEIAPAAGRTIHPTAAGAWAAARGVAGPDDLVCATGSMFLAGELLPLPAPPAQALPGA
jgi:dihydrofolate synthase/folylpolyglutamate synthase